MGHFPPRGEGPSVSVPSSTQIEIPGPTPFSLSLVMSAILGSPFLWGREERPCVEKGGLPEFSPCQD